MKYHLILLSLFNTPQKVVLAEKYSVFKIFVSFFQKEKPTLFRVGCLICLAKGKPILK
ncbi:hypothetical protein STRIC_0453 [Streptococcus ictaluri 707-05]|uniref:Uncharacterized protein n=1 Tax=Streptococcus ictaluri 707-05 TaxID=764299 RepID=G5K5W6_9STRE|nr:hypothetical protein STRIC_0453 [Streptococcus ictaluri 707-05]